MAWAQPLPPGAGLVLRRDGERCDLFGINDYVVWSFLEFVMSVHAFFCASLPILTIFF